MIDDELRRKILGEVLAFGNRASIMEPPFVPGETPIPATTKIWNGMEMAKMVDAVLDGWWTEGRFTDEFEKRFARWIGRRYASFCNSGSSANFLALGACTSHLLGDRRLRAGDPVITVAAGFPTTISPIFFWRLKPIFLDVKLCSYLPTTEDIEKAIDEFFVNGRGAIMLAHTLGNPWPAHHFMDREGIFVIEDNCDALGSIIDGKLTGTLGHLATHSFYPAHHMTTGEGGMVVTDDPQLKLAVESIRDWGRDCWCPPGHENTCNKRFKWEFPDLPVGYDHKYVYSHLGLNLKSTDIQAALGLAQMDKLDGFIAVRRDNFAYMRKKAQTHLWQHFHLPAPSDHVWPVSPSMFGFPITIRMNMIWGTRWLDREALILFLNERKIGTRLLFASNFTRQPVFQHMLDSGWDVDFVNRVGEGYGASDWIVENTFWIACNPTLTHEMIDYMFESIEEFAYDHCDDLQPA